MKTIATLQTLAAAGLLATALPAAAQSQGMQQQSNQGQAAQAGFEQGQQQGQQQQGQQENQQQARPQQSGSHIGQPTSQASEKISGRVQGVRLIQLRGEPDPHVLARIELDNGKTRVLDLGPASQLRERKAQFQKGQQMNAEGRRGKINDFAVIMVDRFQNGGGEFIVLPVRQDQTASRQQAGRFGPENRIVSGTVIDTRTSKIQGSNEKHRLAKIRTSTGKDMVVDLGKASQQSDLQLSHGDRVLAQGSVGRLNGKPALFADQVAEVATISRSQNVAASGSQRSSGSNR